ncbi:MAG: DUF2764 domain-containing protein [Rikenellaceae bacterium]|nr:DUF2764 domain-containing protein [Rikenellaceae bacterium]
MALFSSNYHYLVSSLAEYAPDSDGEGLDVVALLDEIASQVGSGDMACVRMLLWRNDIANIMSRRAGRERYSVPANLSPEQVEAVCGRYFGDGDGDGDSADESLREMGVSLPVYIKKVLDEYVAADKDAEPVNVERALWESYYAAAERSSDRFLREWSRFDRHLRDITAAYTARRKGMEIAGVVVGDDAITDRLKNDYTPDFGLKGTFDRVDELISILDSDEMLSKERRLDELKWAKVDDITEFDYFNIDFILGYLVKVSIICRWMVLDKEAGRQMLGRLIEQLTPAEVVERAVSRD